MNKRVKTGIYLSIVIGLLIFGGIFAYLTFFAKSDDSFLAPGRNWNSPKKVEDYFVERMGVDPMEVSAIRSTSGPQGTVNLRINDKTTLDALIGNLHYYGFIRDEKSFRYALEHTKDIGSGDKVIVVDKNRAIDANAEYGISEDMDAWQIADILLNRPSGHFAFDEYGYFFMP
jgi:hypothetical protein